MSYLRYLDSGAASKGYLVAKVLMAAWREPSLDLNFSQDELSVVAPLLCQSGGGALGWWRVRHSDLRESSSALQLERAYHLQSFHAMLHEQEIKRVITLLRSYGVEPVLVKGWAIARLYPEPGLRPYLDIDLCVSPEQHSIAKAALANLARHYVDLHDGFKKLGAQSWDEMYARSELVPLDDLEVRVLSAEDHLRVLCLHLLRHGAWRPLWLCDVAVAVESRHANFDWECCLGGNKRVTDWVACTIGLAHRVLNAKIENTPLTERAKRLPRWLIAALLRQWDRSSDPHVGEMAIPAFLHQLQAPKKLLEEIYYRWDRPILATVELRGSFNEWPRLPFQFVATLMRSPEVPRQLSRLLRKRCEMIW